MKPSPKKHSASFKAKVALSAIREQETIVEISRHHKVHVNQVYKWKKQLLDGVEQIFESETKSNRSEDRETELLQKIGELTMERDFLSSGLERFR